MQSRNVESRQLGAWLFAGLAAPIAQFAGGMCWQTVAVTAAVCLTVCWLLGQTVIKPGKWISLIEYGWIVYTLTAIGGWITDSWSGGGVYPVVPLILLALGAVSASLGTEKAARAGSTVFWLAALIYSVVAAAGVGRVEAPELGRYEPGLDLRLPVALLIPALAVFMPGEKRRLPLGAVAGIGAFAVAVSVMITGTLSLPVAMETEMPLHEWVEGLTLAGTLQRFEALVSVALTMGWFALMNFLLCAAGRQTENIRNGSNGKGVCFAAVAASLAMLCKVPVSCEIVAAGSMVLWVIVPVIVVVLGRNKKVEISKNNA